MINECFIRIINPSISDPEKLQRMVERNQNSLDSKQNMIIIETAMKWAVLMEENIDNLDTNFIKNSLKEACSDDLGLKFEQIYYLCKSVLMQFWTYNDVLRHIKIS